MLHYFYQLCNIYWRCWHDFLCCKTNKCPCPIMICKPGYFIITPAPTLYRLSIWTCQRFNELFVIRTPQNVNDFGVTPSALHNPPRYICTYIFYIACSPYPPLFFFGLFWIQFGKPSGRVRELCILAFCFVCFGLVFWPLNLIPCLLETPLGNTHSNNHRWFNVLGLTGTLTERARKQLGIVQKQFSEITRQSWNIN